MEAPVTELYIPPPVKKDTRMLGVGLSLAAAALLLFAAFSKHLARAAARRPRVRLRSDGRARTAGSTARAPCPTAPSWSAYKAFDPEHTSGAFAPMGWATFGVCVLAALGLIATAVLAFQKKRPELPMSPASLALLMIMIGLLTGCVFVATKPGPVGLVGVAMGFWVVRRRRACSASRERRCWRRRFDPSIRTCSRAR